MGLLIITKTKQKTKKEGKSTCRKRISPYKVGHFKEAPSGKKWNLETLCCVYFGEVTS